LAIFAIVARMLCGNHLNTNIERLTLPKFHSTTLIAQGSCPKHDTLWFAFVRAELWQLSYSNFAPTEAVKSSGLKH